jgi:hypothetical protein
VSRRQTVAKGLLDVVSQLLSEGVTGFHDQKQKHLLVGVLGSSSANAESVADLICKGIGFDDAVYLAAAEADA